MTEYTFYLRI